MKKVAPSQKPKTQVAVKRIFLNKTASRLIIIFIVLILATLPSYYFYTKYQKSQALLQNPNQASAAEAQVLVNNIGKLIELPVNENPTIATVSDKTQLANQPFFAHAENGDKVLFYSNAKKVILYRPSINKIIDVSPVNIGSESPTSIPAIQLPLPSPSVAPTASPKPVLVPSPTATPAQ